MPIKKVLRKSSGKLGAESLRTGLTDASPMLIIICFIFSLICLGVVKYNYQISIFEVINPNLSIWIALLFAVVVQVGRMAFGFVGVRDLVKGRWVIGSLGICASIGITVFEHIEVGRMVEFWGNESLRLPFQFLVWVALIFELRLIMTMSGKNNEEEEYQKQVKAQEAAEEKRIAEMRSQLDDHYKLQYEIASKKDELLRQQQYIDEKQKVLAREERERKERYDREIAAMNKRRVDEQKEREARDKKEVADRKARRDQELAEQKTQLAKKEAKRKAKLAKKAAKSKKRELATQVTPTNTNDSKKLGNGLLEVSANGQST